VVAANVNDAGIDASRGSHHVFVAGDPARRVGKLLVVMAGGGATNLPPDWSELGSEGARLGYHTIVRAYKNEVPIAAAPPAGCGNSVDPPAAPANCAIDARTEILTGSLAATYPTEGWSQFLDTSGAEPAPRWSEIAMSGQSLGAGQAVLAGMMHPLHRVVAFAGWTDAKHGWVAPGMTPSNRYFTLIHARDNFFARTCYAYLGLGLAQACPLPGFTIPPAAVDAANPLLAENRQPPFATPQIVFNVEPFRLDGVADPYHTSTTRDAWIAREADGTPARKLLNVWRSVLGDSDADSYLNLVDNCPLVANPDQSDSDRNGTGDACGPTLAQGAAGGTVPATLALTLGPAVTFGAFTPGVNRTYDASTTANVITTAGDAALSVSDPGHLTNGSFSLPEPLQVSFSKSAWTAPASNDLVTIGFTQLVKATDALRTGAYSKTLTFTLSTATP
jgi:hypothetical protein